MHRFNDLTLRLLLVLPLQQGSLPVGLLIEKLPPTRVAQKRLHVSPQPLTLGGSVGGSDDRYKETKNYEFASQ